MSDGEFERSYVHFPPVSNYPMFPTICDKDPRGNDFLEDVELPA